jgi:hypothetical protein
LLAVELLRLTREEPDGQNLPLLQILQQFSKQWETGVAPKQCRESGDEKSEFQ